MSAGLRGYNAAGFPVLHVGKLRAGLHRLYCDAGTLPSPKFDDAGAPILDVRGKQVWHVNPSILGLTWAWVLVDDREREVARESGSLLCPVEVKGRIWPAQSDLAEWYAVQRGLQALPSGWQGEVATDNLLTIHRMFHSYPTRSIPPSWVSAAAGDRRRLMATGGLLTPIHLKGHPTRRMLALGHNGTEQVPGTPVSIWNDLVDKLCHQERLKAEEILRGRARAEARQDAREAEGTPEAGARGADDDAGAYDLRLGTTIALRSATGLLGP